MTRTLIRNAMADLFQQNLTGIPAAHIFNSRLVDPKGKSPMIYVTSGGTGRPRLTTVTSAPKYKIDVFTLVILADQANPQWSEEKAENLTDSLEEQINELLDKNRSRKGLWSSIEYENDTSVERLPLGGRDYLVEVIPLVFVKG